MIKMSTVIAAEVFLLGFQCPTPVNPLHFLLLESRSSCPFVGMDLTPVEVQSEDDNLEGQDPQAYAEGVQKRRITALIDKVSSVVFSYIAQVDCQLNMHRQHSSPAIHTQS